MTDDELKDELSAQYISEGLEKAVKSFLTDLDQELAEHTQEIAIKSDHIRIHYYTDVSDKDTKRIETIEFNPRAFSGGEEDE